MIRHLTPRQYQVLTLAAQGLSGKEAAIVLGLSHRTVEVFRQQAVERLDARNMVHAVALALSAGTININTVIKPTMKYSRAPRPEGMAGAWH